MLESYFGPTTNENDFDEYLNQGTKTIKDAQGPRIPNVSILVSAGFLGDDAGSDSISVGFGPIAKTYQR
ncbi:hypothetical protein H5410_016828 [Solanum commersonii]|uniref:Uncharacterized protein n=1 Tax=Solanum commersonii TaxID=4109 RepID=A0A9J5ZYI5_SOLCO|nr:hypothetical protein H5410_016828 [Solanum commersonii]